tara:strand:- start:525 stop:794 length:270 start_codon:yes stop_codon:yes gene_type:complete
MKVVDMSAQGNVAPIIIKKKKVMGGEGHHGGAWKVAMDYSFRRQCFAPVSCLGDPGGLLPSDICSAGGAGCAIREGCRGTLGPKLLTKS